jgi:predicted permease
VPVLLSIFAADILPIFLIAGIGFLLARRLDASVQTIAHVVFYALAPCLVFNTLVSSQITGLQFGRMALLAVLVTATMGLLGWLFGTALRLDRPQLSAFLLVVMFSNGGNYGLPVSLFAFGPEALSHATVYFVSSSMMTFTVGIVLAASGRRSIRRALRGVAKVPVVYSVAAASAVMALHLTVPLPLMRPIGLLSDAALPIMVLVLGMQLERATMPDRPSLVVVAAALSLLAAPAVALALTRWIGLSGAARQAAVVQASMPVAVITTVLALEYDVAPAFVTSTVFTSTLLSPLTLTPLIAYLRRG